MSEENPLQQSAEGQSTTLRATQQLLTHARAELGRVIAGQSEVIGQVFVAVLTQGHALLEGVPGIAKTLIVKSVSRLLGLNFQRVPLRKHGHKYLADDLALSGNHASQFRARMRQQLLRRPQGCALPLCALLQRILFANFRLLCFQTRFRNINGCSRSRPPRRR